MGITVIPRKIEDDTCAKFWGVNKVHIGDLKMSNSNICWFAADFTGVMLVQKNRSVSFVTGKLSCKFCGTKIIVLFCQQTCMAAQSTEYGACTREIV